MPKKIVRNDHCYLCGGRRIAKLPGRVRDNAALSVLECRNCGLVFLSSFSHIADKFYERSGMHSGNVEFSRWVDETASDDERRIMTTRSLIRNKTVLDFGCGNGGYLHRAKGIASVAMGVEPERRLARYFKGLGLKVLPDISALTKSFDVITMFHVLEHIRDPISMLRNLATKLKAGGRVLVEVPNSADALLRLYQSLPFSQFTYWSCHLFLFNAATLAEVGRRAGYSVAYVKHIQRYPISNHLHWLARGRPGGHKKWVFLDSEAINIAYEKQLAGVGATDTLMACFSLLK